jgi:tRNA threonylcarbamoyladenosine biosynthesis protein TsaE
LGIDKNDVCSPTFVLLRLYSGKKILQHFDLYRIKGPEDISALGCQEYFYSEAVTVIEWPERLKYLLPKEFLRIKLSSKTKDQRIIDFSAKGSRYKKLLEKIAHLESFSYSTLKPRRGLRLNRKKV